MTESAKAAVRAARAACGETVMDVRLEEIRMSHDEQWWHVTVSFLRPEVAWRTYQHSRERVIDPAEEYKERYIRPALEAWFGI